MKVEAGGDTRQGRWEGLGIAAIAAPRRGEHRPASGRSLPLSEGRYELAGHSL